MAPEVWRKQPTRDLYRDHWFRNQRCIMGSGGSFLLLAATDTQRMVLGFVLGGMGAGALTALAPCLPAFYAYLFPSVVPFCVRLMLEGDLEHLTMAAM